MQISKDNVFKIEYSSIIGQELKEKRFTRIKKFIKKHRLISITFLIFLMCLSFNLVMIYNFMRIIESI